jgi:hypothetical protein
MSKPLIFSALLAGMALLYSAAPYAGPDPSVDEIYQAARTGHVAQAEQMVEQVLRDNPHSGRAHYVASEVYAHAGNYPRARAELNTAQSLAPGLPFANPSSVSALQNELSSTRVPQVLSNPQGFATVDPSIARPRTGLPWGGILLVLAGIGLVWMLIRRRIQANSYSGYPGNVPPGQPGYGAPGMGGGPYYPGGGGSGLMGSLGTGLAIGAGVAAGEELVHHVLDSDHPAGGIISSANAAEGASAPPNNDMGGQDFGINDGNSWSDSSDSGDSFDSSISGDDWS